MQEEQAMSDSISRINIVTPSYPVKPAQPANKDRQSDKGRDELPPSDDKDDDDAEDKPVIDEYV